MTRFTRSSRRGKSESAEGSSRLASHGQKLMLEDFGAEPPCFTPRTKREHAAAPAVAPRALDDQLDERCKHLMASVTYTIFAYVTRGLFEKDRLIFFLVILG